MNFRLVPTPQAASDLRALEADPSKKAQCKAVKKALGCMETNLKHPGLNTHEFTSLSRKFGLKIFESYAQNKTPGAYRIFWHYGPGKRELTILAIVKHPD